MDKEAERDLFVAFQGGSAGAREAIIAAHIDMAYSMAWHYAKKTGLDVEELVSPALEALTESVTGYLMAPRRCVYSTYAYPRLRAAIIHEVRMAGGPLCGESLIYRDGVAREQADRLAQKLGREPMASELEKHLGRLTGSAATAPHRRVNYSPQLDADLARRIR